MAYASAGTINSRSKLRDFLCGSDKVPNVSGSILQTAYNANKILSLSGGRLVNIEGWDINPDSDEYHNQIKVRDKCTCTFAYTVFGV
jgi:hypothetical protein